MGFGAYDESEHERRESMNRRVLDTDDDEDSDADDRVHHDGEITYEGEADTETLLERLEDIKAE